MTPTSRFFHLASILLLLATCLWGGFHLLDNVRSGIRMGDWSDAMRQWEVCQYVKARINPYELADRLLRDTFGPATGPNRVLLREQRIYSISSAKWDTSTPGLLPDHPPPEATYPPSTLSLLVPTIGLLPKSALLPTYALANLLVLVFLVLFLARWTRIETNLSSTGSFLLAAAVCLCWPPLPFAIRNGQTAVLALLCAIVFASEFSRRPVLSGVLLMLAFLKPSMSLLFAFIPLVRWRWRSLWTVFFLGLSLTILPALWLREWPWVLLSQWMDLCRYVLQGAFTLQEVFNALAIENTIWCTALVLLLWGGVLAWCVWCRHARWEWLFAFLALANLAWTYHERHDFVLLLFPCLLFAADFITARHRRLAIAGLLCFIFLGAAFSHVFYVPDTLSARLVRWLGRLSLLTLWPLVMLRLRLSAMENGARNPCPQIRSDAPQ